MVVTYCSLSCGYVVVQVSGFEVTVGLGASISVCLCWTHVWFLGFYLLFGILVRVAYDRTSFFPPILGSGSLSVGVTLVLPKHSESLNCTCMNFFLLVMLTLHF